MAGLEWMRVVDVVDSATPANTPSLLERRLDFPSVDLLIIEEDDDRREDGFPSSPSSSPPPAAAAAAE